MPEPEDYDPRRPDPELEPGESYGFAAGHEPPPKPPNPPPEPEPEPEVEEGKPRKKKRKVPREEGFGEVKAEHRDRILDQEVKPPAVPWWVMPGIIFFFGALFLAGPIIFLSIEAKSASFGVGALIGVAVMVTVEVVALTMLLVLVGAAFGIDYGEVLPAVVKLFALITFVNGQTLLVAMVCFPCAYYLAILMAGVLAGGTCYGLFMLLFRLSVSESLITCLGIVVSSWLLNFALAGLMGVGR